MVLGRIHLDIRWLEHPQLMTDMCKYTPYSGELSKEETFTNFAVLEPPVKVFSKKFGHFSLQSFPLYDIGTTVNCK